MKERVQKLIEETASLFHAVSEQAMSRQEGRALASEVEVLRCLRAALVHLKAAESYT